MLAEYPVVDGVPVAGGPTVLDSEGKVVLPVLAGGLTSVVESEG